MSENIPTSADSCFDPRTALYERIDTLPANVNKQKVRQHIEITEQFLSAKEKLASYKYVQDQLEKGKISPLRERVQSILSCSPYVIGAAAAVVASIFHLGFLLVAIPAVISSFLKIKEVVDNWDKFNKENLEAQISNTEQSINKIKDENFNNGKEQEVLNTLLSLESSLADEYLKLKEELLKKHPSAFDGEKKLIEGSVKKQPQEAQKEFEKLAHLKETWKLACELKSKLEKELGV